MAYVIVRTDGVFVAPPGSEKSYTAALQNAWVFPSKEEAERQRCEENERVVDVEREIWRI